MSHITGSVQQVNPVLTIGPASGTPETSPNTWAMNFNPPAAPTGTRLLILHFRNVNFPANNRLEVDLGYGMDVFTSANGAEFWTRPVDVYATGGSVDIRYITNGSNAGGVEFDRYGRGERMHSTDPDHVSFTNSDPFLNPAVLEYEEPGLDYDPFWFCAPPPNWENAAMVTDPTDVRFRTAKAVGMIVTIHGVAPNEYVSTCSVTLVDTDVILTAGHCHTTAEGLTSSVTFDYQLTEDGERPPGYAATFYKVIEVIARRYSGGFDYALSRLAEAPPGIPIAQMRHDIPAPGEQVFGIHHPNGAPKKLSVPSPGFTTVLSSGPMMVRVPGDFHVSGGSSGSSLFDLAGRTVGTLSNGDPCNGGPALGYFPTATILIDSQPAPPPPVTRDVMVVFDRSGSMSMSDGAGRTKIEAARDAVSLFVQLVLANAGNRVGLVSFSTAATNPVDFAIANVTPANKTSLIGPAPFSGGIVGGLATGGNTSIGEGLDAARLQFPAPGANPRAILLLTDGLQNTPRMIDEVEGDLGSIDVHAIGFGTASSLDGPLLTALANAHNGLYVRAGNGLTLEKFFTNAFGNIFAAGILFDPEYDLAENQRVSKPESFRVCGEETICVVAGWDRADTTLHLRVRTPGGANITASTPGVSASTGRTWTFLRIPLPHGTERDGVWTVSVDRTGDIEFPPPAPATRYFLSVIPSGGPRLSRLARPRRYYTGDTINPLVELRYGDGSWPEPETSSATVTITRPNAGAGNILSDAKLGAPITSDGDTIPARQATLLAIESRTEKPAVTYSDTTIALSQSAKDTEGRMEEAAVFGKKLTDLLTMEGDYTFHFRASYGEGCVSTRELVWSLHVGVGIDPSRTDVVVQPGGVVITPKDRFGNKVGPGRGDGFTVSGGAGTTVTGPVIDNGDGSYTVPATAAVGDPSIVIAQPDRPPVVVTPPAVPGTGGTSGGCVSWLTIWILIAIILVLLLVLWFAWT
jgi:V8-like Glu-specific endopeptidase